MRACAGDVARICQQGTHNQQQVPHHCLQMTDNPLVPVALAYAAPAGRLQ